MAALDGLFGVREIRIGGVPVTFRKVWNLLGGWGVAEADSVDSEGRAIKVLELTPPGAGAGGSADWKDSVRVATAAAMAASTRVNNVRTANSVGALAAVDGVSLQVGDALLDKDNATAADRGVWVVTSLGGGASAWVLTRRSDFDSNAEVTGGLRVPVVSGTANGGKAFKLDTADPITINVTGLAFSQDSGAGATAGNGLQGTTVLSVKLDGATLAVSASGVKISAAGVSTTELANAAVTGPKLVAGNAAGQELVWDGTQWLKLGRKTGTALGDASVTVQYTTAAQYVWPAATNTTGARVITLGVTGLGALPNAGEGAILNFYLLRAGYAHSISFLNGGGGGGTKFTLPAGYGNPVAVSFYYDGSNWALAGWEDLGTVTAA